MLAHCPLGPPAGDQKPDKASGALLLARPFGSFGARHGNYLPHATCYLLLPRVCVCYKASQPSQFFQAQKQKVTSGKVENQAAATTEITLKTTGFGHFC